MHGACFITRHMAHMMQLLTGAQACCLACRLQGIGPDAAMVVRMFKCGQQLLHQLSNNATEHARPCDTDTVHALELSVLELWRHDWVECAEWRDWGVMLT